VTIKKFLLISLAFHLLVFAGLYFIPEPKINKAREFVANLVSPEELKKPSVPPPQLPKLLPAPRAVLPVRPAPPAKTPRVPLPLPEKSLPSPEKPVVPGEGVIARKPAGEGKGSIERGGEDRGTSARSTSRPSNQPGYLDRKEMFDAGVIDQLARKDTERKKGEAGNPLTFDTREYQFAGYMTKLRQKIESIWVYPPEAAAKGIYGDLKITFTIRKDGTLGAVELVRTSGYKMLDDAAMKALKDGEPYWPLPDSWGKNSYTIQGHFVYVYGGYYLR
jgi:protein TonB